MRDNVPGSAEYQPHHRRRRASRFTVGAVVVLVLLGSSAAAPSGLARVGAGDGARRYAVAGLRPISGPSPFPGGCPGAVGDAQRVAGAELEPMITVSPTNPRDIVATWQQDVGFAARADMVGASPDGGRTWKRTVIGGSRCAGGAADAASDPWISAGPRGSVYFAGVTAALPEPAHVAIVALHSRDGGRTWSPLRTVSAADIRNDKPSVTAHPRKPDRAYVVWWNRDNPIKVPSSSFLRFSRTTDAGRTWSAPTVIDHAPANAVNFSGEALVLPDGTLVAVFARVTAAPDGSFSGQLLAARSRDDGRTWAPPALIVSAPLAAVPRDPETGLELDNKDLTFHSAAVGPDGTIYVAWDSDRSATAGTVKLVRSRDGGRSWTAPAALPGVTAFTMQPALAVTRSGTVGVLWYDTRRDRPGDRPLTTDVWFAHSDDRGGHWRQTHVAGPFDFRRTVPKGRLGEYQGLAPLGPRSFAAAFTQARPQARNGPMDIFFARIQPSRRGSSSDR
jgi:hypothetical protein